MKKLLNIYALTLLVIVAVISLYYLQLPLLEGFEDKTFDFRVKTFRAGVKPSKEIAIIAIDDKTVAELGRFPFSRTHYADLLKVTREAGSKAVLFDIFFPEPQSEYADRKLADSISAAGNVVLAGGFGFSRDGTASAFTSNIPMLQDSARSIAHVNVVPDDDGVIRYTPLAIKYSGKFYPSLALAAAMAFKDKTDFTASDAAFESGFLKLETDSDLRMLINYTGPPGIYERFSFTDVVNKRIPDGKLKNRILFVGVTALGIYDMRITPFSNNSPGVEVNANIADNIIRGDFIRRSSLERLIDLLLIIASAVSTAIASWKLRQVFSFPALFISIAAYSALIFYLFAAGHWISLVYPAAAIVLSYSSAAYLRFFTADRQAGEIRDMFSSYVSKRIVDQLVKNPELAKIGGESRELTIMFADVQNYTTYSESRHPADVVRILNVYLEEMTNIVVKYDGTLDKFMGDGIMAYWNAPIRQDNHAELAARCAIEMIERMVPLQEQWRAAGDEPLTWGVGLNTGEVIIGNIGAFGKKMEYTAIGDNVNLTFRIQNFSREAGSAVMTHATYEMISDIVVSDRIGDILVKGKNNPVEVYALRGLNEKSG